MRGCEFHGTECVGTGWEAGGGGVLFEEEREGRAYYWRVDGMYCSGEGGKGWDRMARGLTVRVVVYLADLEAKGNR